MGQTIEAAAGRTFHEDGAAPQAGQVFVFGSNLSGRHAGGAAWAAAELYGAEEGVSEGLTGNSYALPTVDAELAGALGLGEIADAVLRFLAYAEANPGMRFLVTRVGCGIAGYTDDVIAPMFAKAPLNCSLPQPWAQYVQQQAGAPTPAAITTYKGFARDWTCRGYQFELGKTYEHQGRVQACGGGFHACEYPLDVFAYYGPAESRYAVVEQSGELSRHADDSKVASQTISIKAELSIPGLISAAFEYVKARCKPETAEHATGDSSASSATGYSSASSATGYSSASSATGDRSASSATGDSSASSATGYSSASSATGYRSASSATGDRSASSATGDSSASSATGDRSASSATGDRSASSATGYRSASSATGYRSASSATGDRSASSATGDRSASSATGYSSASLATGAYSTSEITAGEEPLHAVAIATGYQGRVRAPVGCALMLAERDANDGALLHVWVGITGRDGIKPDTWYVLQDGQPVEVQP